MSVGFDRVRVRGWAAVGPNDPPPTSSGRTDLWTAPIVYFFRIENLTIAISPFLILF